MEPTQNNAETALLRLEEPFSPKDVKWLVAATSRDGRKGRVTPYADPRAYTDRLNEVVTASGWTRQYAVHTISPVIRMKKDKSIQTGKVLVTCTVTIAGVGSHSGSGEEWADDENAMTSAEAQAFKRACSCFGLGRYFYDFAEMWVELNEHKQPKSIPTLPSWALPKGHKAANPPQMSERSGKESKIRLPVQKGPLDTSVTTKIEGFQRELGEALFGSILAMAHARSAREIPNQHVQQNVLKWMESGVRGMARVREIAAALPEREFYAILDDHGVESLTKIPNFGVLEKLVSAMTQAAQQLSVA